MKSSKKDIQVSSMSSALNKNALIRTSVFCIYFLESHRMVEDDKENRNTYPL